MTSNCIILVLPSSQTLSCHLSDSPSQSDVIAKLKLDLFAALSLKLVVHSLSRLKSELVARDGIEGVL
jgi:hypothetical protein